MGGILIYFLKSIQEKHENKYFEKIYFDARLSFRINKYIKQIIGAIND